jgi:hypothetical protein
VRNEKLLERVAIANAYVAYWKNKTRQVKGVDAGLFEI